MCRAGLGLMLTPRAGYRADYARRVPAWAADTGCFTLKPGELFDVDGYLKWLDRMTGHGRCLFATAPDVVGNAVATWQRSAPVLPLLRQRGFIAALVGQDGMEDMTVDWSAFDCLFLGGSTDWKLGPAARQLVAEARQRGKWVHMGRVNSGRRLLYAHRIGCQSSDGTYMAYNPGEAVRRMGRWVAHANAPQMTLEEAGL